MTEISVLTRSASTCLGKTPIKILGRIKEPVAAALAYYHNNPEGPESGKGILVYDLGGGTCDIALVCADSNELAEYTVLDSDTVRVGGRNWDKVLFDYVIDKAEE
jgi:molecular chaperone DnaK (HSP70)